MAIQFSSFNFKKNGPQHLKDNIDITLVCKDLLKTDTYAQALAKAIATVAMTGADVAITASGEDALTSINGKSGIDPSGAATAGDDICIAHCNSVGAEVILVADATDRIVTNEENDTINILATQHYSRETTVVV
jgi:hypothetical protein